MCTSLQRSSNIDELILQAPDSTDEAWLLGSALDFGAIRLQPAGRFQFRATARGRDAIELHAPDAPQLISRGIVRFVLPTRSWSGSNGLSMGAPYMKYTNSDMNYVNPRTGESA